MPSAALLVGAAIAHAPRPILVATLAAAAVAVNMPELLDRNKPAEDYRAAADLVNRHVQPGDVSAFFDPTGVGAFAVYAADDAPSVFPKIVPGSSLYDGQRLTQIGEEIPNAVKAARFHPRVWIIESHVSTPWAATLESRFLTGLTSVGYTYHDSCSFPAVRVLLYTSPTIGSHGERPLTCQEKVR